jgi:hypothetical protein
MPSGIYPVPEFRSHPSHAPRERPSLTVRVRTRWRRDRLDAALARGTDSAGSAELELRAAQLRSNIERSRLADALVNVLGDAGSGDPETIEAKPQRLELLKCAEDLQALIERLRDERPVAVRGAALTARLLSDGASPLHRGGGQDLEHAIRAARFALDPTDAATQGLATAA